jgi:hypothetical protein
MKKILLWMAVMPFVFTSCFVTRYVSDEPDLQRKFIGAHVEDVKFELGDPDEVKDLQRGYVYIYDRQGRVWKSRRMVDQYIRVSFNNDDIVRNIQSTTTKRTKKFSGWRTFGLPFTILGGVVIVSTVVAAAATTQ